MEYREITLIVSEASKEAIMNKMSEMGALGFVEERNKIIGYFGPKQSLEEICDELRGFRSVLESAGLDASFSWSHTVLPDRDWNETWKKNFTPIDVGENLTIVPSWLKFAACRIPIIVDPGMVFGTGHHETTRTCLGIIEKIARNSPPGSFLDIGTGTGILAIGAGRLGFKPVLAIDIDPLSVDAARRNVRENALDYIEVREGDISSVSGSFDVIAANLLSEILTEIAPALPDRLNPLGTAVLSGLLSGQEDTVIRSMVAAGLSVQDKITDGKWISLLLSKGV